MAFSEPIIEVNLGQFPQSDHGPGPNLGQTIRPGQSDNRWCTGGLMEAYRKDVGNAKVDVAIQER